MPNPDRHSCAAGLVRTGLRRSCMLWLSMCCESFSLVLWGRIRLRQRTAVIMRQRKKSKSALTSPHRSPSPVSLVRLYLHREMLAYSRTTSARCIHTNKTQSDAGPANGVEASSRQKQLAPSPTHNPCPHRRHTATHCADAGEARTNPGEHVPADHTDGSSSLPSSPAACARTHAHRKYRGLPTVYRRQGAR